MGRGGGAPNLPAMKKLLLLTALVVLGVIAVKKVRETTA